MKTHDRRGNMVTRRFFIGSLAAAGGYGAFGGNRFLLAAAGFKAGTKPNVRFGVVSDIHIRCSAGGDPKQTYRDNSTFRHTLEWFRSQNVDAVVIAGDMADVGMDENLMAVSEAWYSVFPDDKYPDGRPVEKVFVTGNHDWIGFNYNKAAEKAYPDKEERVKHVLHYDMAGWWRKAFREDYTPIFMKEIKGYRFVGAHWDTGTPDNPIGGKADPFARIKGFLDEKGKTLDPALPFFYVQHPHPKDTCYGPWAWGHDKGVATEALASYQNAIAFSGHSHYTLTDERSIWQGAFTSVGTSSLRYTGIEYDEHPPLGFENSSAPSKAQWRSDAEKMMGKFDGSDCRQGMLWSVYGDCIVVRRREFVSDLDLGDEWVLPLPAAESRPFAFAERAVKSKPPKFPDGAGVAVSRIKSRTRGGKAKGGEKIDPVKKDAFKVVVPAAVPERDARLYELEFAAEGKSGEKKVKLVVPAGFNHAPTHAKASAPLSCVFALDELPAGEVRFAVTPINCWGRRGKPLVSEWTGHIAAEMLDASAQA